MDKTIKDDTSLDLAFANITGLKWLPWVGDNYLNLETSNRLFVVGESHYHDTSQQSIDEQNSPNFTREVVQNIAINKNYRQFKIFPNFHRALFRNDKFDTTAFWNLVSFYNFIQQPMNTNKGRPSNTEFYDGGENIL